MKYGFRTPNKINKNGGVTFIFIFLFFFVVSKKTALYEKRLQTDNKKSFYFITGIRIRRRWLRERKTNLYSDRTETSGTGE